MKNIIYIITIVICVFSTSWAQRSIPEGSETYRLIEKTLENLYNTNIEETDQLAEQVHQRLPNHPVYPMLKALALRAAFYPIDPGSAEFKTMRNYLYDALEKSERMLKKNESQPEANFFALASYGLLAMYENQDGNYLKAAGLAKDAYKYLKRGFELKEKYPEFYFSSGLYNYYREKYPELRPVYKPLVWFFRSGNMQLGLEQLEKASQESTFMQAEARDYLSHIYLRYEGKPEISLKITRSLVKEYPQNLYFVSKHVDAAIASESYQGLSPYITSLMENDKKYYHMLGQLFQGMILEKQENDWQEAEQYYVQSLATANSINGEGVENYRSYAYAGLARIAIHEEKYEQAEKLYKQALAAAQYPQTKKEAEEYLN